MGILTKNYTLNHEKFVSDDKNIQWFCSTSCTMNLNPEPSCTKDNTNLAWLEFHTNWHYDNYNLVNYSFNWTNAIDTKVDEVALTYADIYKLTKYLYTKFYSPIGELTSANNFIKFKGPNKCIRENEWHIKFRIWTGETDHKMMLIQSSQPEINIKYHDHRILNCLVQEEENVRNFILYLTGCLFGLWNKDNIRDGVEDIKYMAYAHLFDMGFYTKEEIDQIEDYSFDK